MDLVAECVTRHKDYENDLCDCAAVQTSNIINMYPAMRTDRTLDGEIQWLTI